MKCGDYGEGYQSKKSKIQFEETRDFVDKSSETGSFLHQIWVYSLNSWSFFYNMGYS